MCGLLPKIQEQRDRRRQKVNEKTDNKNQQVIINIPIN